MSIAEFPVDVVDVEYQQTPALLPRVYRPKGSGPFPCIVDVHGGGWGAGDRLNNAPLNSALAGAGIIVAAIDFRLSSAAKYPASVSDVNLAVRWLKSRAHDFGGRPDLVGGLGTSSGGHQLLLNALQPDDRQYSSLGRQHYPNVDARLRFAVACWPVADPWARYQMALRLQKVSLINSHHAYWNSDEEMKSGNPQLILERGKQTDLPPLLIMHGTADDNLTPDMAERFAAQYRSAGGSAELAMFDGEPHAFITRDPNSNASIRAIAMIAEFIKAHSCY